MFDLSDVVSHFEDAGLPVDVGAEAGAVGGGRLVGHAEALQLRDGAALDEESRQVGRLRGTARRGRVRHGLGVTQGARQAWVRGNTGGQAGFG